jgi:DNA-binding IclR family transcriptional regulator
VELRDYFRHTQLIKHTETTLADEAALRAELAEVRRQDFAVDREEYTAGTACVAAPILLHGRPVAAVAVVGRTLETLLQHTQIVQHTAEVISHILSRGS